MRITLKLLPKPGGNNTAGKFEVTLANAVAEGTYKKIKNSIGNLRCSEHSTSDSYFEIVAVKGKEPKVNNKICCEAFKQTVLKKFK